MDKDYQSFLSEICEDLKVLFDSYFSDQTLLVTIHHAIWPITQDALHRVFSPYGSVKKIIPSQNLVDIQFLVQFQGYGAVAARSSLQGRNIYDGCCQLDIQFWEDARITEFVDLKIETRVKATESDEPLMLTEVVEHKQESELNDINDNKVLDELSVKTDEKSDGLDNPKKGLPDDDSTKILLELPKSKVLNFEGCDDVTKWLLKPSLAQGMRLNSLMEDEKNCHQTCQFKQLENTIENVVEGHGSGMKSREWNQHAEWITPIGVGNHKTSLLSHGQGVAGIAMVHNVKFQLLDNALVESDDPYRFRLLLMGNKLLAVDKDSMKHLNEVEMNDPYSFRLLVMENKLLIGDAGLLTKYVQNRGSDKSLEYFRDRHRVDAEGEMRQRSMTMAGLNLIEPTFAMFEVFVPFSCKLDMVCSQHFFKIGVIMYHSLVLLRLLTIVLQGMTTIFLMDPTIIIYVNMLKLESGQIEELVGSTKLMAVVDRLIELDVKIGCDVVLQDDFIEGIFEIKLEDVDGIEESVEPAYFMRKFKANGRILLSSLNCGDSENDAELFTILEVYSVIVSNAQEELLQWHAENVKHNPNIIDLNKRCVSGIIQAIGKCRVNVFNSGCEVVFYLLYEQWRRAEVEKSDKNLQNLKSSFYPLDSWLVKFAKWESSGEDRYSCLITVLLTTKQVEESFTWMHIHHIWMDDLKAKGEHKNNIPYYSLDHKIEVENFSEISLILDEIYEVQLGYSSGISVAAPFYLEALLPVQEPFWTKAKRAFGNVWSNHLKKFLILAFVFKGDHGIFLLILEDKDSFKREVL
ncbi:hypothetical protein GQ457_01G023950 [Hibiscus cannabinus]